MSALAIPAIGVLALTVSVYLLLRAAQTRGITISRLDETMAVGVGTRPAVTTRTLRPFPPRYRLLAPSVAVIVLSAMRLVWRFPLEVGLAFGGLAGVMTYLAEDYRATEQVALIEGQLASTIDLLVGSLRAGASLLAALESAVDEAAVPLRPYLQEVAGRIRLGDDPRAAVSDLATQIPLENFRLFATSVAVHWEVGGSLATTLTTVGRTVRDRVELSRRVAAQGVEAHASVAVVFLLAYLVGFLMWRSNPDRLEAMLATDIGIWLVSAVVMLQAAGLVWMSRLSRGDF